MKSAKGQLAQAAVSAEVLVWTPSVGKAAEPAQGQLAQAWLEAGLGMVGPLARKRLGYIFAGLLDCMLVDLHKGPLALADHHTSRDGPCNLAGHLVAAWETEPQRYSLLMSRQLQHLRRRTYARRPAGVPERAGHMSSLLPRRPEERASHTNPRWFDRRM